MDDRVAADVMIVVEHEYYRLLDRLQYLVDQKIRGPLGKPHHVFVRLAEVRKDRFAEFGIEIFYSACDVAEEDDGIGVRVIELVPHRLTVLAADEIRYQSGLAATRI